MADSFNKKEREKRKRKRAQEKREKREQRKLEGKKEVEFVYIDENGFMTSTPPDPTKKKEFVLEDIAVSTPKKEDLGEEDLIREGTVKFFNTEKGYGFIEDKENGESYFVHVENIAETITERDKVKFEVGSGPKGLVALKVVLIK